MSVSKHVRTGSDSWSAVPLTAQAGLTETAAGDVTTALQETHDEQTSLPGSPVSEAGSHVSEESWVELTAAELESPSLDPLAAAAGEDASPVAEAAPEAQTGSGIPSDECSATVLPVAECDAHGAAPASAVEAEDAMATAVHVGGQKMDLAEFLAGLSIAKAYEKATEEEGETAREPVEAAPLTEREAAARVLASFASPEPTDSFVRLSENDRELEETIDLELAASSVRSRLQQQQQQQSRYHTPPMPARAVPAPPAAAATAAASSNAPPPVMPAPTGTTHVLRRRMVAMDWMRTLRGPSELSPEERVQVFQALFGDTPDAPITAERFKEMMVPFERRCECLGASYGFHHQGCSFYAGPTVTS